jgi:hypothetical protein
MNPSHPDYKSFKEDFWKWFDALPLKKKEVFWTYKEDMSETNFFFTVYVKTLDNQEKII